MPILLTAKLEYVPPNPSESGSEFEQARVLVEQQKTLQEKVVAFDLKIQGVDHSFPCWHRRVICSRID